MAIYVIIIIATLAIVIPILWTILNVIDKRMRRKKNSYISHSKHLRRTIMKRSYNFFSKFPLSRNYINRIRIIYEINYPADEERIIQKTMQFTYGIWLICIVEIVAILLLYPTLTGFFNASVVVIYTANEMKSYVIGSNELKFLLQFDKFLAGVRHRYYADRLVDTAIIEAGEEAGYEMSLHAKLIERILNNDDELAGNEATEEYNESVHNNFLKMFLSLCQYVMEWGDNVKNGVSVFLQNISDMRNEINLEIRNIKENNYMFQSLTFVAMVPILFLYPIKKWAISNLPELDSFYNGRVGIIIAIILYILTILCYTMVCHFKILRYTEAKEHRLLKRLSELPFVKQIVNRNMKKNYSQYEKRQDFLERIGESITVRQLYVKQLIFFICTFIVCNGIFMGLHINEKKYVMNNVREEVATTATTADNDILTATVLEYANQYKNTVISQEEIEEMLEIANKFSNELTRTEVAKEIYNKIKTYQSEYFKWYEVIIALLIAIIAYEIPYWIILYRVKILEMTMEVEVIQFQNIVMMLMYMPNVSILNILEQMETFAQIFRKSIQKCINNYSDGDIEALEELKEDEKFGPFQNLVDNFITADQIGIELAFEEISTDRENSRERRKQETKFSRDKRSLMALCIAFVPVIAILVLYLIGPFLIMCYKMYQNYREQMNSMY